jgi:hypothetical protein
MWPRLKRHDRAIWTTRFAHASLPGLSVHLNSSRTCSILHQHCRTTGKAGRQRHVLLFISVHLDRYTCRCTYSTARLKHSLLALELLLSPFPLPDVTATCLWNALLPRAALAQSLC